MTTDSGRNAAHPVTRDVEPAALGDLLAHPRRATVAFVDRGQAEVLPVRARYRAETYRFGVRPAAAADLENRDVVLVIDDGAYWFELRGISVRGIARRLDRLEGEMGALAWYAIYYFIFLARGPVTP